MTVAPIEEEMASAIRSVSEAAGKGRRAAWKTQKLASTPGYAGADWQGGLMIVGRAGNGTVLGDIACWTPAEGRLDPEGYARKSLQDTDGCPLGWVTGTNTDYNATRSKFWGATRRLLSALEGEAFIEENWSSRLAWSNLYKIAPADAGNPATAVCRAQVKQCDAMLLKEIGAFRPSYLVLATDLGWLGWFRDEAGNTWLAPEDCAGSYVSGFGDLPHDQGVTRFVVATRPDSRRSNSSVSGWAEEVARALLSDR